MANNNQPNPQTNQSGSDNDDWTLVSPPHTSSSSSSSSSLVSVAKEAIEEEISATELAIADQTKKNDATDINGTLDEQSVDNIASPSNLGIIKNVLDSLSENLLKQSSSSRSPPLLRSDYQYTTDTDDMTTDNEEDNDEDGDDEDDEDYDANQTEMSSADSITSTSSASSTTTNEDMEIIDDDDSECDMEDFMRQLSDNNENDDPTNNILPTLKTIPDGLFPTSDRNFMGFCNNTSNRKIKTKSQLYRSHLSTKTTPSSKTTQSNYNNDGNDKALATSNMSHTPPSIIDRFNELSATLELMPSTRAYGYCSKNRLNVALTTSITIAFVAAVGFGIGNFLGWSNYGEWATGHDRNQTATSEHQSTYHQPSSKYYHHYHYRHPIENQARPPLSSSVSDISISEPQLMAVKKLHDELLLCLQRQSPSSIKYYGVEQSEANIKKFNNQAAMKQKERIELVACFGRENYWRNRIERLASDQGIDLRRLISDIRNDISDDLIREVYHDTDPALKLSILSNQIEYLDAVEKRRTNKRLEDTIDQLRAENFELSQRLNQPRDEEYQQMMIGLEMRIFKLQRENDAIKDTLSKKAGTMYMKQLIELEQLDRENDLFKQFYNHVSRQAAKALTALNAETKVVPDYLPLDDQLEDLGPRLKSVKDGIDILTKNINHILLENVELKETVTRLRWSPAASTANETNSQKCSQPLINASASLSSVKSSSFPSAVGANAELNSNNGEIGANTSFSCQQCKSDLKSCLATSSWLHTDVAYWKRHFMQQHTEPSNGSVIKQDKKISYSQQLDVVSNMKSDIKTKPEFAMIAGNVSSHDNLIDILHSLVSHVSEQSSTFNNLMQELSRSMNKSSANEILKNAPPFKLSASSDIYTKHQNVSTSYRRASKRKAGSKMPQSSRNQTKELNGTATPGFALTRPLTELLTKFIDVYTNQSLSETKAFFDSQRPVSDSPPLNWAEAAKKEKELELEQIKELTKQADHPIILKSPVNMSDFSSKRHDHLGLETPPPYHHYIQAPPRISSGSNQNTKNAGYPVLQSETKAAQDHLTSSIRYNTKTNSELSEHANYPNLIPRDYHIGAGQMQRRHQERQRTLLLSDDNKIRELISKAWLEAEMTIKARNRLIGGNSLQLSEPRLNQLTDIVVQAVKLIAGPVTEELNDEEEDGDKSEYDAVMKDSGIFHSSPMARPPRSLQEESSASYSQNQLSRDSGDKNKILDDKELYRMNADYMRFRLDEIERNQNAWYFKRAKQRQNLRHDNNQVYPYYSSSIGNDKNTRTDWIFKRAKTRERQRGTYHKYDRSSNNSKNSKRHH